MYFGTLELLQLVRAWKERIVVTGRRFREAEVAGRLDT